MKRSDFFSESLISDSSSKSRRHGKAGVPRAFHARLVLIPVAIIASLAILIGRLFLLQILEGDRYHSLSDKNRTRTITIFAPRGIIFDRNNTPLVYNVPGFRQIQGKETVLLNKDQALALLSKGEKNIFIDSHRQYLYTDSLAHVLGYVGEISKEELERPEFYGYKGGDFVGKMGIEQSEEGVLRGKDGKKLVEVDSQGREVRTLGETEPISGRDVYLTVDAKLQKVSHSALQDVKKGAIVVAKPDGEILALVSVPSFDPNLFTMNKSYKTTSTTSAYITASEIVSDTNSQPLLNRAVSGVYPPGSTFKLITAAAGLDNGIIDSSFTVEDTGVVKVGDFSFSNWYYTQYGGKDGVVDVVKGIARSNDVFFYKLAEEIGATNLAAMSRRFGLGEKTGIELFGEATGTVPDPKWKEKEIGEQWYLGDTYHYGIGQGFLLTTPLQVNQWTQVIANNGVLSMLHLLKNSKLNPSTPLRAGTQNSKILNEKTVDLIREGMVQSCSPGGVAWPLFNLKIKNKKLKIDGKNFLEAPVSSSSAGTSSAQLGPDYRIVTVACKTGTAQHGGEKTMPHAWITLFAPAYDPQIVVTVLAESSGEGSNIAAPIAKKILEEWFSR